MALNCYIAWGLNWKNSEINNAHLLQRQNQGFLEFFLYSSGLFVVAAPFEKISKNIDFTLSNIRATTVTYIIYCTIFPI